MKVDGLTIYHVKSHLQVLFLIFLNDIFAERRLQF